MYGSNLSLPATPVAIDSPCATDCSFVVRWVPHGFWTPYMIMPRYMQSGRSLLIFIL